MRKGLAGILLPLLLGMESTGCLPERLSTEELERKLAEHQKTQDVKLFDGEMYNDTSNTYYSDSEEENSFNDITGQGESISINGAERRSVGDSTEKGIGDSKGIDSPEIILEKDGLGAIATGCYSNTFPDQSSLDKVIVQSGTFVLNIGHYLQQTDNSGGWKTAYFNNFIWDTVMMQAKVRIPLQQAGVQKVGLLFRYTPLSGSSGSGDTVVQGKGYVLSTEKTIDGMFDVVLEDLDAGDLNRKLFDANINLMGDWHTIGIKAVNDLFTAYFDGKEIFQFKDTKYTSGMIGIASYNSTGEWDNLLSCLP
ncbi:hypothetical protein HYX11_03995 [Candidatus Woesearchaeota archaeon]|nr:hypothetical protein [Candidatus Woesearchaeota archaeon]